MGNLGITEDCTFGVPSLTPAPGVDPAAHPAFPEGSDEEFTEPQKDYHATSAPTAAGAPPNHFFFSTKSTPSPLEVEEVKTPSPLEAGAVTVDADFRAAAAESLAAAAANMPVVHHHEGHKCFKTNAATMETREHVISPMPHTYLTEADLPETYDPRDIDGVNYVTPARNQHIPIYCGSCWAMAATSSFSDRIKKMRNASWPEIAVSPQVIVDCAHGENSVGCHGGNARAAYAYMHLEGVTDDTCNNYQGQDGTCNAENLCKDCHASTGCVTVPNPTKYYAAEFGGVKGEFQMRAEMFARGPIACGVDVSKELLVYTGGVFEDKTNATDIDHAIEVAGWGVEDGKKYWIVRNSWGNYWGEHGWFRLARGINNLAIEEECDWVVPKKTWVD